MNDSFAKMWGYNPKAILGKNFLVLLSENSFSEATEVVKKAFSGKSIKGELMGKHKLGHEFPISFRVVPNSWNTTNKSE